jgi:hypothetical protein
MAARQSFDGRPRAVETRSTETYHQVKWGAQTTGRRPGPQRSVSVLAGELPRRPPAAAEPPRRDPVAPSPDRATGPFPWRRSLPGRAARMAQDRCPRLEPGMAMSVGNPGRLCPGPDCQATRVERTVWLSREVGVGEQPALEVDPRQKRRADATRSSSPTSSAPTMNLRQFHRTAAARG